MGDIVGIYPIYFKSRTAAVTKQVSVGISIYRIINDKIPDYVVLWSCTHNSQNSLGYLNCIFTCTSSGIITLRQTLTPIHIMEHIIVTSILCDCDYWE